ncbi:MAG: nuclear transport factor 2 family protein [Flavobacteriaceae bacterium]
MTYLKYGLILILLHAGLNGSAQSTTESEVKQHIERFFEAFHNKDSAALKNLVNEDLLLQTMGKDREGLPRIRTDEFSQFLISIVSIPDSLNFKEEILSYEIKVDGPMANAWTPYTFWINEKISHCGVNSFQLFNDGSSWKIIYLADTRRREDCD